MKPHLRFYGSAILIGLLVAFLVNFSTRGVSVPPVAYPDVYVKIDDQGSHGSGVAIGDRLYITAGHVAKSATDAKVTIVTSLGEDVEAEVLWINEAYDVALLRAVKSVRIASANMRCDLPDATVRTAVEIIGNPLGLRDVHTWGRVARTVIQDDFPRYAMIVDITIAPGNSGGGAYDKSRRLVGIVSAMAVARTGMMSATLLPLAYIIPSSAICTLLGR